MSLYVVSATRHYKISTTFLVNYFGEKIRIYLSGGCSGYSCDCQSAVLLQKPTSSEESSLAQSWSVHTVPLNPPTLGCPIHDCLVESQSTNTNFSMTHPHQLMVMGVLFIME